MKILINLLENIKGYIYILLEVLISYNIFKSDFCFKSYLDLV